MVLSDCAWRWSRKKTPWVKHQSSVDALVIPVSPAEHGYAIEVAEKLRYAGVRVELDVRDRSVSNKFFLCR